MHGLGVSHMCCVCAELCVLTASSCWQLVYCKFMLPACMLQEVAEYAAREQKRKEMKEQQAQAYIGAVRLTLCLPKLFGPFKTFSNEMYISMCLVCRFTGLCDWHACSNPCRTEKRSMLPR